MLKARFDRRDLMKEILTKALATPWTKRDR